MASAPQAAPEVNDTLKPYVRDANPEEYERVLDLTTDAFQLDPAMSYFASVKVEEITGQRLDPIKYSYLRNFSSFMLKLTLYINGRVVVVVDPALNTAKKGSGKFPEIVGAAFWHPPNQRVQLHYVMMLVKCGFIRVLRGWGLTGLWRAGVEWLDTAHIKAIEGYKSKGVKQDPDNSWYLMMVMVDPAEQKKGHLSRIWKEALERYPDATFTLDATTPKSKAQYAHLGFEVLAPFKLGVGKVSAQGLPANGDAATGFEVYAMAKFAPGLVSS